MSRMVSTRTMVDQLEGLLGTGDLTERSKDFVRGLVFKRDVNLLPDLTDGQVDYLESLWQQHFA
jgi:hypothetical protein